MAFVSLENVSLKYPVPDVSAESFKKKAADTIIGGLVGLGASGRKVHIEALKNINLFLKSGDRLHVSGPNGAGKSSLLKLIAGIYAPESGNVQVEGRIATLFGLSSGVLMDCSGYENIIRMLMLLGHSRTQAIGKFEMISAFSELDDYLSMPVRTYSAGMFVRLMYAIATSVEPEILIVDEMLGVGDERFIKKSHDRMRELIDGSRIVIIASHSEELAKKFCNRTIILQRGEII